MDRVGADFPNCIEEIGSKLNKSAAAIQIPLGSEENFEGVIDLIEMKSVTFSEGDLGVKSIAGEIPSKPIE